jgi:O-antigen chain-terminating methyltransferase
MPLVHARDAAQAKIAAIGSVNPRAGGPVNQAIQFVKKSVARALHWFVRDQVVFNREMVAALEATLEALTEHNRALVSLAAQTNEQAKHIQARTEGQVAQFEALRQEARELRDIRNHWIEWRREMEHRLATNEVQFLRSTADLQSAFQHRSTLAENNFREIVRTQHADYLGALDRTTADIHKQLWRDFEKVRAEYGKLIHDELRIIRMRTRPAPAEAQPPLTTPAAMTVPSLDYTRFAYRFRGQEEEVRRNQEFYKPYFANCRDVLDIGCGRGEFLELVRDLGVEARGIDLGEESIAYCKAKGLNAEEADLFSYLAEHPEGAFDGIFSSQVVEHIEPGKLPEMVRLCASRLRRGGILAIETPNPECLAIFATYFYLDPTHTRPVPSALLEFYMEEAGMGEIEIRQLAPAIDSMPELEELPGRFRERFFGGLDYAIIGRKL